MSIRKNDQSVPVEKVLGDQSLPCVAQAFMNKLSAIRATLCGV